LNQKPLTLAGKSKEKWKWRVFLGKLYMGGDKRTKKKTTGLDQGRLNTGTEAKKVQ